MEVAAEKTTTRRRQPGKGKVVFWAGGGGGGCVGLLLLGGAVAATAAFGVAFLVRAATKNRTSTNKGTPCEAEEEKRGNDTISSKEGKADGGEDAEGLRSAPPPPPPLPKWEDDSVSTDEQPRLEENHAAVSESGAEGSSATAEEEDAIPKKSNFVRVQEKIIGENASIGGEQEDMEENLLPVIVNKAVVVDESKIIQVVKEFSPDGTAYDSAVKEEEEEKGQEEEEEEDGSPVEEGTKEVSAKARDPSMGEADPAEMTWSARAMEPSLPLLEENQDPKVQLNMTKEELFHGNGEKHGTEETQTPWKKNRVCVLDRMVVEMKEKGFSMNAQLLLLISTLFFTTVFAILVHHYSNKLHESTHT